MMPFHSDPTETGMGWIKKVFSKFPSLTIGAIASTVVAAVQVWQGSESWAIAVPAISSLVIHLFVTPAEDVGL